LVLRYLTTQTVRYLYNALSDGNPHCSTIAAQNDILGYFAITFRCHNQQTNASRYHYHTLTIRHTDYLSLAPPLHYPVIPIET
jgi:hypothetical protein